MAELLLKPRKRYSAMCVAQFSVKEICAIVSSMAIVADTHRMKSVQTLAKTETMRQNGQLSALLNRIANKDKLAFEQFYDNTIKLCFSQASRITRKEDIAEEVVSDVYMQVWNKAESYDEQRSGAMTWLMMLCRSRALDALRRSQNQQRLAGVDLDAIAEPFTDENPQDFLHAIRRDSLLHSAISQLKPQQRQLLSLAYFKGLTHNEISEFTGIPLGTVKTQIRRSVILLKELMCEQGLSACDKNRGGSSYE